MRERIFPFLRWFPISLASVRADVMAGIAVAMVLVPQSMAYAQLAGMPPVYGLYASFLPVIIAALWGSSNQLATGPVAVVSLLTASTLMPFAAQGSDEFVAMAIALALLVGLVQLGLGVMRMGALVSFISHPVIVGFTNAAAIVIALSQLNKIFGVPLEGNDAFMVNIANMLMRIPELAHGPTILMGLGAIVLMWALKRFAPRAPGVLIAVVLATVVSWAVGFERQATIAPDAIADPQVVQLVETTREARTRADGLEDEIRTRRTALEALEGGEAAEARYQLELLEIEADEARGQARQLGRDLRSVSLFRIDSEDAVYHTENSAPADAEREGPIWRIDQLNDEALVLNGGGRVVGNIPEGLPGFALPELGWTTVTSLITAAFVIALVGFTEAIAIAKAMAVKTGQRLDPNQELIGQGLANIVGSTSQAFPVSGSFSRSAVNIDSGAVTGLSSVVTGLIVVLVLFFFTPLLYHLPEAVLAAIIMMAVIGLINVKAVRHAWEAHKHDGIAAVVTFVATLAMAPNLDLGILVGAGLAIGLFLWRSMKPRVSELARFEDGTLRDAQLYGLETGQDTCVIRYDGRLYFANVSYFEDAVLDMVARHPDARYVVIVGKGINEIDASGEEAVRNLAKRLAERDITLIFAGVKAQVMEVMQRTHLIEVLGEENIFRSTDAAIDAVNKRLAAEKAGGEPAGQGSG